MGSANTSNSSSEYENMNNTINDNRVVLNVYDLTPINNYTYWFGFGIFHTGIEGQFYSVLVCLSFLIFLFMNSLLLFLFGICFNFIHWLVVQDVLLVFLLFLFSFFLNLFFIYWRWILGGWVRSLSEYIVFFLWFLFFNFFLLEIWLLVNNLMASMRTGAGLWLIWTGFNFWHSLVDMFWLFVNKRNVMFKKWTDIICQ